MSRLPEQLRMALQMVGPVHLAGLTLGDWLALLRRNQWRVDPPFWPRALLATLGATVTSLLRPVDQWLFSDECDQDLLAEPVFVLGLYRSGTTMLFHLLAQNPCFAFPTRMDAFYPHIFRTLHAVGIPRLLALVPGQRRSLDNVRVTWLSPEEDSLALCVLAGYGERLSWCFPRGEFDLLSPAEFERQLQIYSRRLVQIYRRALLFKTPSHICQIPQILRQFPRARFVTIFRDPQTQFRSTVAMLKTSNRLWGTLQWPVPLPPEEFLSIARANLGMYFEHRDQIPAGNLIEIRYEDLAANQTEVLQSIHRQLRLPKPEAYPPVEPYTPNTYPEFDPATARQIRAAYAELYNRGLYT